jgi:hypothetical protein
VIDSYPTDELPPELQQRGEFGAQVRLVIEAIPASDEGDMPLTAILEEMRNERALSDDPVRRVRALRSEWDRREELHARIRAGNAD